MWEEGPGTGGGKPRAMSPAWQGTYSLLLPGLLEDESDELLEQQDEDEQPNDPAHDGQDDERHRVIHLLHCRATVGQRGESGMEQESPEAKHAHPHPQPSPGLHHGAGKAGTGIHSG